MSGVSSLKRAMDRKERRSSTSFVPEDAGGAPAAAPPEPSPAPPMAVEASQAPVAPASQPSAAPGASRRSSSGSPAPLKGADHKTLSSEPVTVRITISCEKRIVRLAKRISRAQNRSLADIWRAALRAPLPDDWWQWMFVDDRVLPSVYFMRRHRENDGRESTSTLLGKDLHDALVAEWKALAALHGDYGPQNLSQLIEAKIVLWGTQQE